MTRLSLILAVAMAFAWSGAAVAQNNVTAPPANPILDENSVNLSTGQVVTSPSTDISIGPPDQHGLRLTRQWVVGQWRFSSIPTLGGSTTSPLVSIDDGSWSFTWNGSSYSSDKRDGSLLSADRTIFTARDGTIVLFDTTQGNTFDASNLGQVRRISYPDGTIYTFKTKSFFAQLQGGSLTYTRIKSITSNTGYQLRPTYSYNADAQAGELLWRRPIRMTAINSAVEYCDPDADSCTLAGSWPHVDYSYSGNGSTLASVADPLGNVSAFAYSSTGGLQSVTSPGASIPVTTAVYDASSRKVTSISRGGLTWVYQYASGTTYITNPLGHIRTVVFDPAKLLMSADTNAAAKTTAYTYCVAGDSNCALDHLKKVVHPEGDAIQYKYDVRGNILETRQVSKTPGTPADIVTSALYPATCANPKTCNQPTWTKDALGNQTDYTYDAASGQVLTVARPAAVVGGVRPTTSFAYTSLQASYSNGAAIVSSGLPIALLSGISTCQATASCVGTADEVATTISYGSQAAGVANNLLPVSVTHQSGTASLIATTAFTYDSIGNRIAVDGPLASTGDTTTWRYDADRRVVGTISPDPDDSGPLKRRAVRTTFDPRGRATLVEYGVVTGADDAGWNAFSAAQSMATTFDDLDRPLVRTLKGGATTYAVTQTSYDKQRVDCTAVRMNAASWGALPASACTLTSGSGYTDDRITKTTYDNADRPLAISSGYGTAGVSNDSVNTYTNNGLVQTLTDGNGNTTTYEYDGMDRLTKVRYPVTTTGNGGSSTTDFEQYGYDAAGNVISRRQRDGQTAALSYDALGRLTTRDVPNTVFGETDKTYGYDLMNRLTSASDSTGRTLSFGYDALSRLVSQGDSAFAAGAATYQYDLAGQRTRLTWSDGAYEAYAYLTTGEVSTIRENGGTALATFAYDDLGRRTGLSRANGTTTNYAYDPVSRLQQLTQDVAGTASDQTVTLTYDAAGGIATRSGSNDAYAFNGYIDMGRSYVVNGLNQVTTAGGTTIGHDARGSLAASGSDTFAYTSENRLAQATASGITTKLAYDALDRLYSIDSESGIKTALMYDGADVLAELNQATGAVLRRYVYGPGIDEPLVWYEGTGITTRRWLHADERGSIVAVSDDVGAILAINRYDEYGYPGPSGNLGRFQYTGQKWLPSVGLYDYKARMYSPRLGRFMQTDPIAYADGMNWYAYAHADPVNGSDPTGLLNPCPNGNALATCSDIVIDGRNPNTVCTGLGCAGLPQLGPFYDDSTHAVAPGSQQMAPGTPQNDILNHDIGADIVVVAKKVPKPVQKFISDWIVDYDCGFIDSSACSWSDYASVAGLLAAGPVARFAWLGREIKIGKNFRLAPFGNRTGHPLGRWPHYHYRPSNPAPPGQGIGRHRPWE